MFTWDIGTWSTRKMDWELESNKPPVIPCLFPPSLMTWAVSLLVREKYSEKGEQKCHICMRTIIIIRLLVKQTCPLVFGGQLKFKTSGWITEIRFLNSRWVMLAYSLLYIKATQLWHTSVSFDLQNQWWPDQEMVAGWFFCFQVPCRGLSYSDHL